MDVLRVKKFIMITVGGGEGFSEQVNKFIKKGYVLFGQPGIHILWSDEEGIFYTQAMVLFYDEGE